ncbi:MAG TPA: hypothetical protein PK468_09535 [Candidatus Hydrogenedentes bacterium]|nr:hypothetical protein [Candidatus Hydrogenedentota bacterium]
MAVDTIRAVIPLPIQVVVDDVGWRSGEDGHARNEPFRTGISRDHVPADYDAIALLGKRLGIRPQAAMILCEWDRENRLRRVPTATWMGESWDNRHRDGPWIEEAAAILDMNRAHIELALHGVGHEYWQAGRMERAEWHDSGRRMRPPDQVNAHLDAFHEVLEQRGLGAFPTSFVPAAFLHAFGPSGYDESLAAILAKRGVTFISTPFNGMRNREAAAYGTLGFDAGVMTVDRGQDLLRWFDFGVEPKGEIHGPICGMHWPNLLHPDPERNTEIVDAWTRLLRPYDSRPDTLLACDSTAFRAQLVHHTCTHLDVRKNVVRADFSTCRSIPDGLVHAPFAVHVLCSTEADVRGDDLGIDLVERKDEGMLRVTCRKREGRVEGRILVHPQEGG